MTVMMYFAAFYHQAMHVRSGYYLLVLTFPVFFVLHRINEYFGVVPVDDILRLLIVYCAGAIVTGFMCLRVMKDERKAFVLTTLLLFIFFLFGVIKEFLKQREVLSVLGKYSVLLPSLGFLVYLTARYLRKSRASFRRLFDYTRLLMIVVAGIEIVFLVVNLVRNPVKDFGDKHHTLINNITVSDTATKPAIYWIILDEYSASRSLKQLWSFDNPLDSQLRAKGFFVADSAQSAYNYTHYSVSSILDMQYLQGLPENGIVNYKDMVYATKTLYENNVIDLLEKNGYDIYSRSIFDLKKRPALPFVALDVDYALLIRYTTLSESIRRDIAWNFEPRIVGNPENIKKVIRDQLKAKYDRYRQVIAESQRLIAESAGHRQQSFYLLHFMMTHDPWLFNPDGSFFETAGYDTRDHYTSSISYMNKVVNQTVDAIVQANKNREFIIIVQSDHGFRYEEHEPEFNEHSCNIFYAVYCSDHKYPQWTGHINAVNTFRIVFNKYFGTAFPMLPSQVTPLRYRRMKE